MCFLGLIVCSFSLLCAAAFVITALAVTALNTAVIIHAVLFLTALAPAALNVVVLKLVYYLKNKTISKKYTRASI